MLAKISQFIFPERCNICRKPTKLGIYPICKSCKKSLYNSFYKKGNNEKEFFLGAAIEFDKTSQKLVHKLKYDRKEILARIIGKTIFQKVLKNNCPKIDIVIPVPIFYKRKMWRGFNQTDFIATELSKLLKCSVNLTNLQRIKNTQTQTKLNKLERKENMREVFSILNPILFKNKNILIIDDVITTGATIESCRQITLQKGAKNVYTASFARA